MFSGQTLVDQLEVHHLTWKAYMQSMPSTGYTGGSTALYAQKHNPFVYFMTIRNNPAHMQRIIPFTQFDQDMKSGNVANFVWITPDICSDMHGVSAVTAVALGIPACATSDGIIARGDSFIHTIARDYELSRLECRFADGAFRVRVIVTRTGSRLTPGLPRTPCPYIS